MVNPTCVDLEIELAELQQVVDRLISGVGLVRVPEEVEKPRYVRLSIDVIRTVEQPFNSFKFTPSRSRYCTVVFLRQGYVVDEQPVDYERRVFDFVVDRPGQTLIAVKCAYEGILQTFFNLGNALNLPSISITNLIEDFENLNLLWDEAVITCEGSTAVQARLAWLPYDTCNPENNDEQKPPPPPPPLPTVSPGESIGSISPPLENDPFTRPNDLDEIDDGSPFPVGEPCELWFIDYTVFLVEREAGQGNQEVNQQFELYAPVEGFDIQSITLPDDTLFIRSFGLRIFGNEPCLNEEATQQVLTSGRRIDRVVVNELRPA